MRSPSQWRKRRRGVKRIQKHQRPFVVEPTKPAAPVILEQSAGPTVSGNIGTPLAILPSALIAYTEPCGGAVSVEIAGNTAPVEVFE